VGSVPAHQGVSAADIHPPPRVGADPLAGSAVLEYLEATDSDPEGLRAQVAEAMSKSLAGYH